MNHKETLRLKCGATMCYSIRLTPGGDKDVYRFHIADTERSSTIADLVDEYGQDCLGEKVTINITHESLPKVIAFLQRALKEKP